MHKIKKYANRKMYDATDKKYISMKKLAELIKAGEEVSIIDNKTGEDITSSIVSRLLANGKKEEATEIPANVLMQFLRKGGATVTDYAKKYGALIQNGVTMTSAEIDKRIGKLSKDIGLPGIEAKKLKKDISEYSDSMKSWIGEKVEKRVNEVVKKMNLASKEDIENLNREIDKLEKIVKKLEKKKPKKKKTMKKSAAVKETDSK